MKAFISTSTMITVSVSIGLFLLGSMATAYNSLSSRMDSQIIPSIQTVAEKQAADEATIAAMNETIQTMNVNVNQLLWARGITPITRLSSVASTTP